MMPCEAYVYHNCWGPVYYANFYSLCYAVELKIFGLLCSIFRILCSAYYTIHIHVCIEIILERLLVLNLLHALLFNDCSIGVYRYLS